MSEQIIFLGSGGGRLVVANQFVGTGGFVVKSQGYQVWVDPGPGALVKAKQYNIRASQTDMVYVTHHHIDHANDANAVVDAMTFGGARPKGIFISTDTLINGTENESPMLSKFYRKALKECCAIKAGDKVKAGPLTFEATPAQHDTDCIGLKLYLPDRVIGYTSDTALTPELIEAFKGCDVLIANVLKPGKEKWKTHFCSADAEELFRQTKPKLGIISHFGLRMIRSNPVSEAREIAKLAGVPVFAAREGMKVDLKTLFVS